MPKGEDRMTTLDDSANQLARLLLTSLIEIRHTQNADQGRPAVVVKNAPMGVPGKVLRAEQAGRAMSKLDRAMKQTRPTNAKARSLSLMTILRSNLPLWPIQLIDR
jgi:hypothetical protein